MDVSIPCNYTYRLPLSLISLGSVVVQGSHPWASPGSLGGVMRGIERLTKTQWPHIHLPQHSTCLSSGSGFSAAVKRGEAARRVAQVEHACSMIVVLWFFFGLKFKERSCEEVRKFSSQGSQQSEPRVVGWMRAHATWMEAAVIDGGR